MTTNSESHSFSSDSKVRFHLDRTTRVRLKHVAQMNPGRSEAARLRPDDLVTFLPMEAVGTDGMPRFRESVPASTVWKGFTYFRRGDILLAKITPCFENGKTALLDRMPTEIGFGSTEFHVLRPGPQILPQYLHHVIRTDDFRRTGEDQMTGAAGQQRIPTDFVAEYQFRLPPLDEQRAIARFLDRKSRRIARFILARQRMIALLNEQKQAIIHQAVTRGLDPDVPLKPSGIDWLDEIPANWTSEPLKRLARNEIDGFTDGDWIESPFITSTGIRLIQTGNIGRGFYKEQGDRYISEQTFADLNCKDFLPNDVLICRLGNPVGRACLAPDLGVRMITSVDVCMLKPREDVSAGYLVHLLSSDGYLNYVQSLVRGSTRDRVSRSMLGAFVVPLPPTQEQHAIAVHVNREASLLEELMNQGKREIELIREYRTRLIADVVTGMLDIRDHPDASEDAPDDLDQLSNIDLTLGTMDEIDADPDDLDDALPREDSPADAD